MRTAHKIAKKRTFPKSFRVHHLTIVELNTKRKFFDIGSGKQQMRNYNIPQQYSTLSKEIGKTKFVHPSQKHCLSIKVSQKWLFLSCVALLSFFLFFVFYFNFHLTFGRASSMKYSNETFYQTSEISIRIFKYDSIGVTKQKPVDF